MYRPTCSSSLLARLDGELLAMEGKQLSLPWLLGLREKALKIQIAKKRSKPVSNRRVHESPSNFLQFRIQILVDTRQALPIHELQYSVIHVN